MNTHFNSRQASLALEPESPAKDRLKIPFNNSCSTPDFQQPRLFDLGNSFRHVKKTLPPTLTGFPGKAEILYYVKVTVQRPAFYKENYRSVPIISELESSTAYTKILSRSCTSTSFPSNQFANPPTAANLTHDDNTNSHRTSPRLQDPHASLPQRRPMTLVFYQASASTDAFPTPPSSPATTSSP